VDSFVTETRIELLKENLVTRIGMLKGSSEMRRMRWEALVDLRSRSVPLNSDSEACPE